MNKTDNLRLAVETLKTMEKSGVFDLNQQERRDLIKMLKSYTNSKTLKNQKINKTQ